MPSPKSQSDDFQLGDIVVDPRSNEIVKDGERIRLDHKVMQLLLYFAAHPGRELSKEEILRAVWGEGVFSDEVLTVAVSSLRKALGDRAQAPTFIKTIPRFGYCLLLPKSQQKESKRTGTWLIFLEQKVGLRFLIIAAIVILILLILLTKTHLHY